MELAAGQGPDRGSMAPDRPPRACEAGAFPHLLVPAVTEAEVPPTTPAGLAAVAGGPAHETHPVQLGTSLQAGCDFTDVPLRSIRQQSTELPRYTSASYPSGQGTRLCQPPR